MTHPTDYPMPGTTYLTGTANTAEIQRKHGVVSPFSGRPKHIPARPWIQRLAAPESSVAPIKGTS